MANHHDPMTQWRILVLDTKKSNPNHYICLAIARALGEIADVERVVRSDYVSAIQDARAANCNLFIAFDGEELDRPIVERIAQVCGRSVLWVTEDPYERSVNVANAGLFDLVFTNDAGSVAGYGDKGRHLALAADPRFHQHPIPPRDHDHYLYDLFFAGTAWPNRSEFLERLQAAIPHVGLKLALPSNPYIPAPRLNMDPSAYDWRTPNTEFAKFANRSRSVLTLHRAFSSSGNDPVAQTPGPRFFEVALAGGFQLVDTSIPEIRVDDFYCNGIDYVGFNGPQDCIEKLQYYLAHPDERLAIARSAQQATLQRHLYRHRVTRLLEELAALPAASVPAAGHRPAPSRPSRRRVLVVSHNITGIPPYGGVEVYQESVRQALSDQFEFLFYTPDRSAEPWGSRYVLRDQDMQVLETFSFDGGLDDVLLTCPQREAVFSALLYRHRIELVHFQHLIGHPPSLGMLPAVLGIRSMLSLHDYHAVCSRFNLLDYREVYCNIAELPPETCDVCLNAAQGAAAGSQARRRAFFGRVLDQVDVLHANTQGVADLYARIYPGLRDGGRLQVNPVPMPKDDEIQASVAAPAATDTKATAVATGPLRIAVPGNFTRNKGGNELIHAFNQLRGDDVQIDILGPVPEHYRGILDVLRIPNLTLHGAYAPGTLPRLLAGHHLSIHFSIWPETYCISLSEAWAAGLVPIVSDIGALGERVVDGVNGYKLPVSEAGSIVHLIRRLAADRRGLEEIRQRVIAQATPHHDEHMQWLASTYRSLLPLQAFSRQTEGDVRGNSLRDLGILLVEPGWAIRHRAATVVGNADQLQPALPVGRLKRGWRYFRKHGLKKTIARLMKSIVWRLNERHG